MRRAIITTLPSRLRGQEEKKKKKGGKWRRWEKGRRLGGKRKKGVIWLFPPNLLGARAAWMFWEEKAQAGSGRDWILMASFISL
jgi:hypothetical protein